ALSVGASERKDDRLPLASATPGEVDARATVNVPTEVSGGPAPSAKVRVAVEAAAPTEVKDPPEGTPLSVQGVTPAVYAARGSEKPTVTESTLPLPFVSNICSRTTAGAALSAGAVAV